MDYLSRCDVGVGDVSVDVLYLRQLPLCHLDQFGAVQLTVATHRSVPGQRPALSLPLHGGSSPCFSPPCSSTFLPFPPQGPSIPPLPAYCHWMMWAGVMGVMVEFRGTRWCTFFFLTPILLRRVKKRWKGKEDKRKEQRKKTGKNRRHQRNRGRKGTEERKRLKRLVQKFELFLKAEKQSDRNFRISFNKLEITGKTAEHVC